MLCVIKIRRYNPDDDDPLGWYTHPAGTVAGLAEPSRVQANGIIVKGSTQCCCVFKSDAGKIAAPRETEKSNGTRLSVRGMTCGSCAIHVTRALENLHGVDDVRVSIREGEVCVLHDSDGSDVEDFIKALSDAGYEAEKLPWPLRSPCRGAKARARSVLRPERKP